MRFGTRSAQSRRGSTPELLLHLGAHKTGSTYFQHCLRSNPRFFAAQDSFLVWPRHLSSELVPDIVAWRRNPAEVPRPASLDRFVEELRSTPARSVMWSYEGLLGEMNLYLDGGIYPHAPQLVTSLGELLADTPTRITFTVRSYPDFIESAYKWLVRNSQSFTFKGFMSRIDVDGLSWRPVVEALRETFGEENVQVIAYEAYRADSQAGNHQMLRHLYGPDANLRKFRNLDGVRGNPSPNRKALEFARLVHHVIRRSDAFSEEDRQYINTHLVGFLGARFTAEFDPEPAQLFDPDLKAALHARYVRECEDLGIALTLS